MHRCVPALLAPLLAFALVAGGCSDEGEGEAESDASTPADSAESAGDPDTDDPTDDGEAPGDGTGDDTDVDPADGAGDDLDDGDAEPSEDDVLPGEDPPDAGDLPADPDDAVPGGADIPAEAEDYCRRSFEASERTPLGFDPGTDEVRAYYEQLAEDVTFLADTAPPAIAEAAAYVAGVFTEAAAIVAEAGYDLSVADPLLSEFASEPERADAMEAAISELEQYDAEVCGLTF